MEGILECKEEIIQARKPFTEFILNREAEEDSMPSLKIS